MISISTPASPRLRRTLLLLALAASLATLPASAQLIANGTYTLANHASGELLDVSGALKTQGAVVDQYPSTGNTNQQWQLTNLGNNVIELLSVNSGLALDVYQASTANGAEIDQWPYSGNANQRWTLTSKGSGFYQLVAGNSGLALEDPAYSTVNGKDVDQYTVNGGTNQQWSFTLVPGTGSAQTINSRLGKPNRVLMGLGSYNTIANMQSQGIQSDIIDTYLPGVGSSSWISYSSPSGSYVGNTANQDNAYGAIPMFTLYGMAQNGDGSIADINQSSFMNSYWSQARLMFQQIGSYGKPTLVNLEPDFWGYVELDAPSNDPTKLAAVVNDQSECSSLPNTAAGIAECLLKMGRQYAPQALIGFPASFFGETAPTVATFMQKIQAQNADFIVAQTSDRDAGCAESSNPPSECQGRTGPFYWDENNQNTPNFQQSLTLWSSYRGDLGSNLPILWWQTPLGVPSSTPGGTTNHYRDDHVDYMMKNAYQYGNIDTFGIVFSGGASSQTNITTDGGEFASQLSSYLSHGGNGITQ
jgi:hypothetical protein